MAIHIQSGKNTICKQNAKIQSIPFKILADSDAKVTEYFEPYVKLKDDEILTASYRGYPLQGKNIPIPEGYTGVVLHESIRPTTEKEDRKFYVVHDFKSLVYWNWDKKPSKNDGIVQALDWIDIAAALHSPIEEE